MERERRGSRDIRAITGHQGGRNTGSIVLPHMGAGPPKKAQQNKDTQHGCGQNPRSLITVMVRHIHSQTTTLCSRCQGRGVSYPRQRLVVSRPSA